jgi:hypothetical protein
MACGRAGLLVRLMGALSQAPTVATEPYRVLLTGRWRAAASAEHQILDLVLYGFAHPSTEMLPDTLSGDIDPKLRPHCDHATRDGEGQMPDSDQ